MSEFGVNSWFVLELIEDYLQNPKSVSEDWQKLFRDLNIPNGSKLSEAKAPKERPIEKYITKQENDKTETKLVISVPAALIAESKTEEAEPIRGVAAKIIENMTASLSIPVATSLRTIPVKVLEENRIIINRHLKKNNSGKISFTHIIGWAIVKAIRSVPVMNYSFTVQNNEPHVVKKHEINLGLAVDIEKKDGSHSLIVPNIKKANTLNFKQFFNAYNDIIKRSRSGKIEISDFQNTTITLTNPGTIGTVSSAPRLMAGQGAIIATGALDFPAEYQAVTQDVRVMLGISKVMNVTSTYDHRIIQGAESGLFLKKLSELILGEENFYDEIFSDLQIPLKPVVYHVDNNPEDFVRINNIEEIEKQAKAIQLINMYRVRGHLLAHLDPLKPSVHYHHELDPSSYGFTVWDYDREFITDGLANLRTATLRKILQILNQTYCDAIGVEYRHIQDSEEKQWLQERMESVQNLPEFPDSIKKNILYKLSEAEYFEHFIHTKYLGHKRFSIEGSETIIPVLDYLLNCASKDGVEEIMLGMAHRGRLNVLANIIGKSMYAIFSEFEDITDTNSKQGSGDVKYHLGASGVYKTLDNKDIRVSIASNPSHLEFVNPVVEGIVRAKQSHMKDEGKNKVIPVLLHGDAAFAGEGIVAESINLSQLHGYATGGTVHIIINNQIGFTTAPADARSTIYASDVAKMVQAPIFHVNGDDPEASLWVTQLAFEYRQKFKKDVVIDVYGYRRLGHNEGDEPGFTQPLMYKLIKEHLSVLQIYRKKLLANKIVSEEDIKKIDSSVQNKMLEGYEKAKSAVKEFKPDLPLAVSKEEIKAIQNKESKITDSVLNKVVEKITTLPEGFSLHPKLKKFIDSRKELLTKDVPIDWAFAEALAFGTLLNEGINVRLSGQDSARGTFSQRHLVLTDIITEKEIIPHNNINPGKAIMEALDSLLSEAAVLGFEFGYSTADPTTLVLWEAQFGDFANAAQPIIDNFIVCSDAKWKVPNNLALLLPHGQEGQGPEHSSARIERFLALCAGGNMTVSNPSTAAQYYHLLRSQGKYTRRRPVVIFTPKSLLRHPEAKSSKQELITGRFRLVIDDELIKDKSKIKRIIICSGKVNYDLVKYRRDNKIKDTAIVRIERFYPYPADELKEVLNSYSNVSDVVYVQEEPENMGALNYISRRLPEQLSEKQKLKYISREASPSPSPGSNVMYLETQNEICRKAFV